MIDEYRFTIRDAESLSGVSQKNIRTWMERKILPVGKQHFTGRWMLNLLDVLQLSVMDDLSVRLSIPPSDASKIAKFAVETVTDWRGKKLPGTNSNILIAIDENGERLVGRFSIDHHGYRVPPLGDINQALRRSHVVIPVTAIFEDILSKVQTECPA